MRTFACAVIFSAAIAASAQQKPIILHDAALVDGTGAQVRPHVDITIHKGYIDSIKPAFKEAPKDAEIVDCTGRTIIPGLISAHSHLGILLDNATPSPDAYTTENVTKALDQFERYGVTTIVSLGVNRDLIYQLRDQQRDGKLGGATILTAGRGIGVPNGAPGLNVPADQIYRPATPDEARKDVDEMASHKVDLVKMWLDSGHGKVPPMKPEIYTAVIEQAHKHHLKVAAHVYNLSDARSLVNANIDIFAHSVRDQAIDPGFARTLIDHKIWYIPTLALDEAFYLYAQEPDVMHSAFFQQAAGPALLTRLQAPEYAEKTLASEQTRQAKKDHEIAMKNLKTLYDAGVNIGFGTDSGAVPGRIPGFSEHRELEDLVAAGLTPLQAITLATGENGRLLHEINSKLSVGLIRDGYSADLIVLAADPSMDVRNTRRIVAVYHHGVLVPNPPPQN